MNELIIHVEIDEGLYDETRDDRLHGDIKESRGFRFIAEDPSDEKDQREEHKDIEGDGRENTGLIGEFLGEVGGDREIQNQSVC